MKKIFVIVALPMALANCASHPDYELVAAPATHYRHVAPKPVATTKSEAMTDESGEPPKLTAVIERENKRLNSLMQKICRGC